MTTIFGLLYHWKTKKQGRIKYEYNPQNIIFSIDTIIHLAYNISVVRITHSRQLTTCERGVDGPDRGTAAESGEDPRRDSEALHQDATVERSRSRIRRIQ